MRIGVVNKNDKEKHLGPNNPPDISFCELKLVTTDVLPPKPYKTSVWLHWDISDVHCKQCLNAYEQKDR